MARTAESKQPASEPYPYAKRTKIERETLDMAALRYAGMMGHEFVGVCTRKNGKLRYAGMMGHEFVGVCTRKNGKRDVFIEANDAASCWECDRQDVAVYRRTRLGWESVKRGAAR
jgi:hypothetical protein